MTVPQQIQRSLDGLIAKLPSEESRRSYRQDWVRWSAWLKKTRLDVRKVKPRDVEAHLTGLQEGEYAKSTIGRALSVIRVVYGAFVRDELMAVNPAREVTPPRMSTDPKTPYLTVEQITRLLNLPAETWEERRDRVIVYLFFGLGFRRSEIARLRLEECPPNEVRFSKLKLSNNTCHAILKGFKEVTVGVPQITIDEVVAWCAFAGIDKPTMALLPRWDNDPTPMSAPMLYKAIKKLARRAEVPKEQMTPHGLRRSYITRLREMGADLKTLQLAVGHSSQSTTERYDQARETAESAPGQAFAKLIKGAVQ